VCKLTFWETYPWQVMGRTIEESRASWGNFFVVDVKIAGN